MPFGAGRLHQQDAKKGCWLVSVSNGWWKGFSGRGRAGGTGLGRRRGLEGGLDMGEQQGVKSYPPAKSYPPLEPQSLT